MLTESNVFAKYCYPKINIPKHCHDGSQRHFEKKTQNLNFGQNHPYFFHGDFKIKKMAIVVAVIIFIKLLLLLCLLLLLFVLLLYQST